MKIIVIFYRNDKRVRKVISSTSRRVSQIASLTKWTEAHLKVLYGKGVKNEGVYNTKTDFRQALSAFCEK